MSYIRSSGATNLALARELGVSDVLISKVRRRLLWTDAAEALDRNDIPRRAILATLVLAGVRVSELCGLTGEDVDLEGGRIRVRRAVTKTDAGERVIPMLPALRAALVDHVAAHPYGAQGFRVRLMVGRAEQPGQPPLADRRGRARPRKRAPG